jgi:ABC-2 type transport system ATP-binding protein
MRPPETVALKGVSLNVSAGEVLALLGPNGSGKSTTLKLIAGMLLPDYGAVIVNGANTQSESERARRQVGFAVASERSFYPRLTARENLDFFAALEEVSARDRRMRVESVLHEVQLTANSDKLVMKFSSGMYQRLAIARSLLKNPRVLLLDEPTRSLDPQAARSLQSLVRKLCDRGRTIVLATHNLEEAVSVAHRVVVLEDGHIRGSRQTLGMSAQQLQDYHFDAPSIGDLEPWAAGVPA